MPELPEIETTRRGITPHLLGREIAAVVVREPRLRWPVPPDLGQRLGGGRIRSLDRRAKYLLIGVESVSGPGTLIVHLGMSGSLSIVCGEVAPRRHDHFELRLDDGVRLRLNDPRRFGSVHWTQAAAESHFLLRALGPEPLGPAFDGDYLYRRSRGRRAGVKSFIMDAGVVVGVGNIYASEALFRAGIRPGRPAGAVSRARYARLTETLRATLNEAIELGGTTLRDFVGGDGRPGYFRQSLAVYGRGGEACHACGASLRAARIGQRMTVWCPRCQR